MLTVNEYAQRQGITQQGAYQKIKKDKYKQFVIKQNGKIYIDEAIFDFKEEEPQTKEKRQTEHITTDKYILFLEEQIKELKEENEELKTRNNELQTRLNEYTDKVFELTEKALQLTENNQYILSYDKKPPEQITVNTETIEEPQTNSSKPKEKSIFKRLFR